MSLTFQEKIHNRTENEHKQLASVLAGMAGLLRSGGKDAARSLAEIPLHLALNRILLHLRLNIPDDLDLADEKDLGQALERFQKKTGLMRRTIELTGSWWKQGYGPLLAFDLQRKPVVLLPGWSGAYSLFLPHEGSLKKVGSDTSGHLQPEAICFYRTLPSRGLSLTDLVRFIAQSVSWTDWILVLSATLAVVLSGLALPLVNRQVFNTIIPSGTQTDVIPAALLLFGTTLASAGFLVIRNLVLARIGDEINLSVFSATMARILMLPASFFRNYSSGDLTKRVSSLEQLSDLIRSTLLKSGLTALLSFLYLFQMFVLSPSLFSTGLVLVLAILTFTLVSGLVQNQVTRRQMFAASKHSGTVFQLISGVQKVKLAGAETRAFTRWANEYQHLARANFHLPLFLRFKEAIQVALALGGTLLLFHKAGQLQVAPSDYIAFTSSFGALNLALADVVLIITAAASVKPLLELVEPVLASCPEIEEDKPAVDSLHGTVELSHVSFRYEAGGPLIVDNLSLSIQPGEYLGIVGRTGCGKSTVLRLLLGFENPESGGIYYDGNNLDSLDPRSVRRQIGVVMQNGKLFSGDIYSNIVISAPWLTQADAWEAARSSGLDRDIETMPMGMFTIISEGGGGLSGGQRQRLMIARAIAGKPGILFFDEATSALDNITQKIVSDSIAKLKATRLVIAHRLSTIRHCDRIIFLDQGKIQEEGTFEELMQLKGLFYEHAMRQMA